VDRRTARAHHRVDLTLFAQDSRSKTVRALPRCKDEWTYESVFTQTFQGNSDKLMLVAHSDDDTLFGLLDLAAHMHRLEQ